MYNKTSQAYWGLSSVKYQHYVADMAYPPYFKLLGDFGYFREKRVATHVVHVLTFDWNQVQTAAMLDKRPTAIHNTVGVVVFITTVIIIIAICVATVV